MRYRSAAHRMEPFRRPAALVMTCGLLAAGLTAGAIADGPPAAATGGTLWVGGTTGKDTNDCQTPQTPCKTISRALEEAHSGYRIKVAGIIHDNVTVPAGWRLVFDGTSASYGNAATVISVNQAAPVFAIGQGADVTLDRVHIFGSGRPRPAGGILNDNGTLHVLHSLIWGENTSRGAGIDNEGAMAEAVVAYSVIFDNYAGEGAGIYNHLGTMVLNYSTVIDNRSSGTGGGVQSDAGYLRVFRSTIDGNTSVGVGGGIYTLRPGTPTGARLIGYPDLELTTSTIAGNTASVGGAIADQGGLDENRASTIYGNTGRVGTGGIYDDNAAGSATVPTVTSLATILAGNTGGNCAHSGTATGFRSDGYNLTDGPGYSCGFTGPTDIANADPELGPLKDNGGLTKTMLPALSSPAVDKIPPGAPVREALRHDAAPVGFTLCGDGARDQRLRLRPLRDAITAGCTIGAVEVAPLTASVRIVKSGPPTVTVGGPVRYTLRVSNDGPGYAAGLAVSDPMSRYLTDVSVPHSSVCRVIAGRRVRCDFGTLAPGTSRTVTVTVRVAPGVRPGTIIENCGAVSTVTPGTGHRDSCVRTRIREVEVPVTG